MKNDSGNVNILYVLDIRFGRTYGFNYYKSKGLLC